MRLPLHGFVSETLTYFGLAPGQLMPKGWRILLAFVVLCRDAGVPTSLAVFRRFFSLGTCSRLRGWYYFRGRDAASSALFTGLPKCAKGWHDRFFFLTSPEPWRCPVRWGGPPSKISLTEPVLTVEQMELVAKLRGAHDSAVDLGTYLCEANLTAAFSSSLARESPDLVRPTSAGLKVMSQSAKKVVASGSATEMVKTEPGGDTSALSGKKRTEMVKTEPGGDTSALSGKKRNLKEAHSKDGLCHSEVSTLPADHSCSATCLCTPPGFDPIPRHLPVLDTRHVDRSDLSRRKEVEVEHTHSAAAEPSDVGPATYDYEAILQTVNDASSYALQLKKELAARDAELEKMKARHTAERAELEKKLLAQGAEVVALRGQLKHVSDPASITSPASPTGPGQGPFD